MKGTDERINKTLELSQKINNAGFDNPVAAKLYTSERVLARITDGIYRMPSSALRELICNAYDADATSVEIQTNPPDFDEIMVKDNGNGLTLASLSYLVNNIGGSAKRTILGSDINVCSPQDPTRSPGGRKLIGKIGIGLFSVAQLTKHFQIVTKRKKDDFRLVADVVLKTHSEEDLLEGTEFETGTVRIWKVPAADLEGHGTLIHLKELLPKTKEHLRSQETWMKVFPKEYAEANSFDEDETQNYLPPQYHIGRVDINGNIATPAVMPWEIYDKTSPDKKMNMLVQAVYDIRGTETNNPSISKVFDNYFQMIWTLGLALPINYIVDHPFDTNIHEMQIFSLSNAKKGQATKIEALDNNTVREVMNLKSPERGENHEFSVIIDGIELFRPLRFFDLLSTPKAKLKSIMFVGTDSPDLSKIPKEIRGGDLEFEAYFLWNSVIVPKEHAGVLIRINDASGTSFDESFMRYPTSETIRMKQVTAEIFVKKGLDAALNIDRESFNYSHPHYQYLSVWVHNAFRQISNKQKELSKNANALAAEEIERKQNEQKNAKLAEVERIIESISFRKEESIPEVIFTENIEELPLLRKEGTLAYNKQVVFQDAKDLVPSLTIEEKAKAIIQIFDRMGILEAISYSQQQELISKIVAIISK